MTRSANTMGRFDGHVAVVTGGSSGIGLATAKRLYQEGARVAIAGRDEQRLREAAGSIGDDVLTVPADVAKPEELDLHFSTHASAIVSIYLRVVTAATPIFHASPTTPNG